MDNKKSWKIDDDTLLVELWKSVMMKLPKQTISNYIGGHISIYDRIRYYGNDFDILCLKNDPLWRNLYSRTSQLYRLRKLCKQGIIRERKNHYPVFYFRLKKDVSKNIRDTYITFWKQNGVADGKSNGIRCNTSKSPENFSKLKERLGQLS